MAAPHFSLQYIRVFGVVFQGNKKIDSVKNEFYLLAYTEKDKDIVFRTMFFQVKGDTLLKEFSIDSLDPTIKQGVYRGSISKLGNIIRRFAEIKLASNISRRLDKDDIIVLDGTLQAGVTGEIKVLQELYDTATKKQAKVTALAKTSTLFTEKGNNLSSAISSISPEGMWYYHPVVEINYAAHKADMYFVRLNINSDYVFRFEVYKEQECNIEKILTALKDNSKDVSFPGYPYGLILADKFARVSNQEKEYIRTTFMAKAGKEWKNIIKHLNALNAHSILDNIS